MNRMFQVIVVGGLSLTGYACGRAVVVEGGSSGAANTSPGPPIVNGTAAVTVTTSTGFPGEGPATSGGGFPSISGAGGATGIGGFGGAVGLGGAGGLQGLGGVGGVPSSGSGLGGSPAEDAGDASFPMEAPPPPQSP